MAQEKTDEEVQGTAEQLPLPLTPQEQKAEEERQAHACFLREELDLIPVEEFARAVGLAEQTLAAWRSEGKGPGYVKLGKTVFYRRADLKVWIEKCAQVPPMAA